MNVETYIHDLPEDQMLIASALHDLICTYPEVTSKIRYKIPFYFRKSWICYINPLKKGGVELCFLRADELSNESGVLDFKERKQVAGITILNAEDLPEEKIITVLQEAFVLDEAVKYKHPKSK